MKLSCNQRCNRKFPGEKCRGGHSAPCTHPPPLRYYLQYSNSQCARCHQSKNVKGELHSKSLLCSLKIINTFLENSMVTLKQRISNLNCTKILVGKAVLPLIKPCEILFWKELKNLLAYWILMPFLSSLENMLQLMLTLLFHKNVVNFEIVNNAYSKLVWGAVLP